MSEFSADAGSDLPEWAKGFQEADFRRFLDTVRASLAKRGIAFEMHEWQGYYTAAGSGGKEFGLHNLADLCKLVVPLEWPDLINEHLDLIERAQMAKVPHTYEEAKPLLKVRLYPLDAQLTSNLIQFAICEEFHALLMCDFPEVMLSVNEDDAAAWPPREELLQIATENLRSERPEGAMYRLAGGGKMLEIQGPSFFTASQALLLDRFIAPDPHLRESCARNGALVAIPSRHVLYIHPIENQSTHSAYLQLARLAEVAFREEVGGITPTILWWRNGTFTPLRCEITPDTIHFAPPDEYVQMLNTLTA